jgi:hypothetical protein
VNGFFIQAWAGSALFRRTKREAIQLGAYPVLGIEGLASMPVFESNEVDEHDQPLFYIDQRCNCTDMESFLKELVKSFTRQRLF